MYVYLESRNGFNDILSAIKYVLNYCKETNRTLLLNTINSCYSIKFDDYFSFKDVNIITDIDNIKNIISDKKLTISFSVIM